MRKSLSSAPTADTTSRPELKLDWCSHAAAKYAVENWHYSKSMPTPPIVKIGVWEDAQFIGCVLFSRGANNNLGKPYGLDCTEVCELTRVALREHKTPVSRICAIALKMMLKTSPGLKLCVSYADPNQGHAGGIYQAGNWIYCGQTASDAKFIDKNGRAWHSRQVSASGYKREFGELRAVPKFADCKRVELIGKHRYLMPLDDAMRKQIEPLRKPYPKRAGSITADAPVIHTGEGGAAPTPAL